MTTDQSTSPDPDLSTAAPSHTTTSSTTTPVKGLLGLGLLHPSSSPRAPSGAESVLTTYPHLGNYIFTLLASIQSSPPRSSQHPLSVSSSGGSDDEESPPESRDERAISAPAAAKNGDGEVNGALVPPPASTPASRRGSKVDLDKDALVKRVVELLDEEMEEEVKEVLKPYMGDLAKDDILMEQVCLDCMHRRRDDQEGRPYQPHLTPSRPRITSTVSSTTLRPYTPTRLPSYRAPTPLGRPQSPIPGGAQTPTIPGQYPGSSLLRSESSPKLSSANTSPTATAGTLSAKASAFNPSPRLSNPPLTATGGTFNPSDPWKDAPPEPPRTASPFMNGTTMSRTGSSRGIAAPLFSDQSSPFHSPHGTPNKGTIKMPDVFSFTNLQRAPLSRTNSHKAIIPDDDEEDEFSPFGTIPVLRHPEPRTGGLRMSAKSFEPGRIDMVDAQFDSSSTLSSSMPHSDSSRGSLDSQADDMDGVEAGTGMTPLDVLHSVFTSVPKAELESALHAAGYEFEGAMAILVSQYTLPRSGASTPHRVASPRPLLLGVGSRGAVQTGHHAPSGGYFNQGGRSYANVPQAQQTLGSQAQGGSGIRTPGGLRMCRYFLAGECRRSDCRFSHDLDRALCRFWLRGNCAKGPNCEFLHQLPPNMPSFDPRELSSAMSRLEVSSDGYYRHSPAGTPTEEFPDLLGARTRPLARFDPSRNRFANALKRPAPMHPSQMSHVQVTGSRMGLVPPTTSAPAERSPTSIIPLPRPSTRIKLRAPTLLPTLQTGAAANEQYMTSRQTALRLGHARNACLARAADAFRRGDGAAAKRFSREGKSLNEKMTTESAEAALMLVKERRADAQRAVRERDGMWSDDPMDRSERGKAAGGGLGVIMGVASRKRVGTGERGEGNSADERMEALLDLHTLHGNEGVEVLGQFLAELERENYRGLTYVLIGEEKHVGMQDPSRGASKTRLGASIKSWLTEWGYAWMEGAGWVCVDSCRY